MQIIPLYFTFLTGSELHYFSILGEMGMLQFTDHLLYWYASWCDSFF